MKETSPLIKREGEESKVEEGLPTEIPEDAGVLYRNFVVMCIAFSFNHGCVVSCLAYATTELGDTLGGYGSGALYVFYSLTAFFLAKPIVSMIGPKYGLVAGVCGYCIYIAGFLFSLLVPSLAWPVFMTACSIGGVAGGLLWTSQGRYFARNAKLYSTSTGITVEKVNATFAGVFAISYLGLEMVTKGLATVLFLATPDHALAIIFSAYTIIAAMAAMVVLTLSDLKEEGTWDFNSQAVLTNAGATGKLVYEDPRLALLLPFQIAFGFASSFVPYYVLGTVVADSDSLGSTYVGLLSAVIVFTGALMAMPAAWAANKFGKPTMMTIGGLCLTVTGAAFFVFSDEELGTWGLIIPFLVVYGMGRGTWVSISCCCCTVFSFIAAVSCLR